MTGSASHQFGLLGVDWLAELEQSLELIVLCEQCLRVFEGLWTHLVAAVCLQLFVVGVLDEDGHVADRGNATSLQLLSLGLIQGRLWVSSQSDSTSNDIFSLGPAGSRYWASSLGQLIGPAHWASSLGQLIGPARWQISAIRVIAADGSKGQTDRAETTLLSDRKQIYTQPERSFVLY
ncbi:hypothetical protein F7725_028415 [Dissostichus mawsoni]|uniref:Uncharacterized protein n=1 Tax=Dissostichus mawsoni TaxID=36200 RepID=A0A7J5XGU9_DISMA|nr:hypothetical protein F7725_028415 [Dissostichus mawsoni]